jgi:hypothetical protein
MFWSELLYQTEEIMEFEMGKEYFKGIMKWLQDQYPKEVPENVDIFNFLEKVARQNLVVTLPSKELEENFKAEISVLTHFRIIEKSGKTFVFSEPEYFDFFGAFYIIEGSDMKSALILNLVQDLQYSNMLRIVNRLNPEKNQRKSIKSGEMFKQTRVGKLLLALAEQNFGNIYNHFLDLLLSNSDPKQDLYLIKEIVYFKNKHGLTSLHVFAGISDNHDGNFITNFFNKLQICNQHLGKDFVEEYLKLKTSDGKSFIHLISSKEFFQKMLEFVGLEFGETFLKELLLSKDDDGNLFLYYLFMKDYLNDYLGIVKQKFGTEFLKQILLSQNENGQNFLYSFNHNPTYSNNFKITRLLNFLHSNFGLDENLFVSLLCTEDVNGTTFLQHFVATCKLFMSRNKKLIQEKKTRLADKNVIVIWLQDKFKENCTKVFPQIEKSNRKFMMSLK